MLRVVFHRLLAAIPVLIGVSVVVFFMAYLAPGDPAEEQRRVIEPVDQA